MIKTLSVPDDQKRVVHTTLPIHERDLPYHTYSKQAIINKQNIVNHYI